MKRIILIICFSLIASVAVADMSITTPIVRPSLDQFRVRDFRIVNNSAPYVSMKVELGYIVESEFVGVKTDAVKVTNYSVTYNYSAVAIADSTGLIESLPVAYQTNPANKVILEINSGTFGGNSTLIEYIEQIIKVLAGL